MTDRDYTDDLALLGYTPAQTEYLLLTLKQPTGGIDFHVDANRTKFICFKQEGAISSLRGKPLKLVEQFPYLGDNISSTESNVNMHLAKVWTAIDRLSLIWKSEKIKRYFF